MTTGFVADVLASSVLVIENISLIDPIRPQSAGPATLVLEKGQIRTVTRDFEPLLPENVERIDGRGLFVMPGIADMHNHLRSGRFAPGDDQLGVLRELLQWGVTTVLNPGVATDKFAALRTAIASNPTEYPTTFLVNGLFTTAGGWGDGYRPETVAAARALVRELRRSGSDGLKLMYDDMRWATTRPFAVMDENVLTAIVDEAHVQGMQAFVHAPILSLAKQALRAGVDCLLHGILDEPVDAEFISLMQANGACYISTLVMFEASTGYKAWADRLEATDLNGRMQAKDLALFRKIPTGTARLDNTAWAAERLPVLKQNLMSVYRAGIPIVIGTDTGIPGVIAGLAVQIEMIMHAEAGMPPLAVLEAATNGAAVVMGRESSDGQLVAGAPADLLILDADPRLDVGNVRHLRQVIRAGRVVH
jgi:imidazolonepropionase-like amidohydrolase